jgi:hypothetical protein
VDGLKDKAENRVSGSDRLEQLQDFHKLKKEINFLGTYLKDDAVDLDLDDFNDFVIASNATLATNFALTDVVLQIVKTDTGILNAIDNQTGNTELGDLALQRTDLDNINPASLSAADELLRQEAIVIANRVIGNLAALRDSDLAIDPETLTPRRFVQERVDGLESRIARIQLDNDRIISIQADHVRLLAMDGLIVKKNFEKASFASGKRG